MSDENRPRLGRGLAALLGDAAPDAIPDRGVRRVAIGLIAPNPRNPRRTFDDAQLDELADSIRAKGLIQPVVVRVLGGKPGHYELIAGERRWRAAQKAGLHEVPVVVVEATDQESLELAIVENVQRQDLNQIEEARGYDQLMKEFGYTQNDLSKIIGKSRSHLANTLRLLGLPASVQELVENGAISAGHARAVLAHENPEAIARRIVEEGLNVRQVEQLSKTPEFTEMESVAPSKSNESKDPNIANLERSLAGVLGLRVQIKARGNAGQLRVIFENLEQLDMVCDKLRG